VRVNPGMRVVVLLREPVSRAYSSFQYLRAQGREPEEDFLAAVEKEPARRAANWHHLWHYTAMSRYADAIEAFREALPEGHVGIWFHDELESDYTGTLQSVTRFLGLPDADVAGDVPRVNVSGTPRHQRVQRAIWWASEHRAPRLAVRTLTSWRFREAVRARIIRRDSVPAPAVRALSPVFDDDRARLRALLTGRRDLPSWLDAGSAVGAR
jgi:hypothetical protein